jgi:DNA replication protein DnaC
MSEKKLIIPCMMVNNGIPVSHQGASFDNFDFDGNDELMQITQRFLACEKVFWLYLHGKTGRGKTHYAVALHRAIVAQNGFEGADSSTFVEWASFTQELRESFDDHSYDDRLQAYLDCDVLVIDDLVGQQADFKLRALEEIVRERYSRQRRLVVTTNESFDWFTGLFGAHEVSRIGSLTVVAAFAGRDRRLDQ